MKVLLLALVLSVGNVVTAQSFSWDNEQPQQQTETAAAPDSDVIEEGMALVYPDYYEGNPTALGETFQQNLLTAAHQEFPLGTIVKVTRIDNGLSTTVRINDRGAYCDNCVIDLSKAAAQQIKLQPMGRSRVQIEVMGYSASNPTVSGTAANPPAQPRWVARGEAIAPAATPAPRNSYPSTSATQPELTAKGGQLPEPNAYEFRNTTNATNDYNNSTVPATIAPSTAVAPVSAPAARTAILTAEEDEVVVTTTSKGLQIIEYPISPFAVQLGSYSQYANAERHALRLNEEGFKDVYLLKEKAADGSLLNRVIIAPFEALEDAQEYQNDLREMYQMKSLVFQARMVEVD